MITIVGEYAVSNMIDVAPERVRTLYLLKGGKKNTRQQTTEAKAFSAGIDVRYLNKADFEKETSAANHQGMLAKCQPKEPGGLFELKAKLDELTKPLVLVLDEIQDPHNLGACLRSAEVFGVDLVIWPKHRAVKLNQTVYKIASGAVERLTLIEVTNLVQAVETLQSAGVWVTGLAGEARQSIQNYDLTTATALVMGNEHKGLRALVRKKCDTLLSIPQQGSIESLNVSVACGIALYEANRQRLSAQ